MTPEEKDETVRRLDLSHRRIKAVTELPIGNETKRLYTNCHMMSVQRMSQDEYMLNLAFVGFENNSEQILDQFLDQYQQKKTMINATA